MPKFTPGRLTLARKRMGLSITALAQEVDLSTRTLSAYENGNSVPSSYTLEGLARRLQVKPTFFSLPELDAVPVDAVSFRALSKMTARQRDAALSAGAQIVEFDEWLSRRFRFPKSDVPTLPGYNPETAAATVRARWGLGEQPITHVVRLLEAHGIRMYSLRDDLRDLDAFSFNAHGNPYILASTRKSAERSRFDAAHELGHLVLHCEHARPGSPESETEANRFAAAFLMPSASVLAAGLRNATMPRVIAAKSKWGVAAMALTHRLHELSLLTEWGYRDLCVQLSRAGYRRSEPGGLPRESSERLRQAFSLLHQEGITTYGIAAALEIEPTELKSWTLGIRLQAT